LENPILEEHKELGRKIKSNTKPEGSNDSEILFSE
jgi:hypothetical protein